MAESQLSSLQEQAIELVKEASKVSISIPPHGKAKPNIILMTIELEIPNGKAK